MTQPLDGPGAGRHAVLDVAAFEGRAGGAGDAGDLPTADERDLGVGADIDGQRRLPRPESLRRQQHGHVVGADEAGDVGEAVDVGAGRDRKAQVARLDVQRSRCGRDERWPQELVDGQMQGQVVHGRVAHQHRLDDVLRLDSGLRTETRRQFIQCLYDNLLQLAPLGRRFPGVHQPRDDVFAVGRLRIQDAAGGQRGAAVEIDEIPGDLGGADIKRQSQLGAGPRPEGHYLATPHRSPHVPRPRGLLRQLPHRLGVNGAAVDVVLVDDHLQQGFGVGAGIRQEHGGQVEMIGPHRRVRGHGALQALDLRPARR